MRSPAPALVVLAALAALAAGCGADEGPAPADDGAPAGAAAKNAPAPAGDRSPAAAASDAGAKRLPPALAEVEAQAGELLDGGAAAFEGQLEELEGHPVVVNKWASWCAPCRAEFPFFQAQAEQRAGEVAFLGVDSSDNDGDAAAFLDEYPVPYPSYKDPDLEVADVIGAVAAFPTTSFYDADGERVYVKQGGYASEELLAEDIERYAE